MRIAPVIISLVASLSLSSCGNSDWTTESDDALFDVAFYGPVQSAPNDGLREVAQAYVEADAATLANPEAYHCRDFSYRTHLTIPDQHLIRCRDRLFVVVREGEPIAQLVRSH